MKKKPIIWTIAVLIIAAVVTAGIVYMPKKQSNSESEEVVSKMEQMIPNFRTEQQASAGMGRDPLAAMSINGIDIVGGLEIPSIGLCAPVTVRGEERPCFASVKSGSPVRGRFCLIGGRDDVFSKLSKCKPSEKVAFTDVDGIRYDYTVTTQFHLKKWDKADYELMLCYKIDQDTYFVLACDRE